ncbi:hypothetical protein IGK74_002340 [Enterococcus sp. AZ150]|uniref:hypothetical protein n=1 Tax=Enterococcus sp. AZ150 TaxID=2774866 RepID=UPI003F210F8C
MKSEYVAIATAFIGILGSNLVAKITTKPTLDEKNVESANTLYNAYEKMNQKLEIKVEELEKRVEEMRNRYEAEIQQLRAENKALIEENTNLKVLLGGNTNVQQ